MFKTMFFQSLNKEWAYIERSEIFKDWFIKYDQILIDYNIFLNNIYNIDKKSFIFGSLKKKIYCYF